MIKTSKHWVLPPRPRPGRKPNPTTTTNTQKKEPKKTYKKKSQSPVQQVPNSPIELALQKIKDENLSLKVELSKLVSDLKALQGQTITDDDDLIHKRRMDSVLMDSEDDDNDNASQISTPSLMSSSSYMTQSTSSLDCIQEEQHALKIDDFLTASFFEQSSNSITVGMPPSLPSTKQIKNENAFEFDFLKNETNGTVLKNDAYDPLFQVDQDPMDIDNEFWEWK